MSILKFIFIFLEVLLLFNLLIFALPAQRPGLAEIEAEGGAQPEIVGKRAG